MLNYGLISGAVLLLLQAVRTSVGADIATCDDQLKCLKASLTSLTSVDELNCGDCTYKLCLEIDYREGCPKSAAPKKESISHVCTQPGDICVKQDGFSTDMKVEQGIYDDAPNDVFTMCQYGHGEQTLNFLIKDGNDPNGCKALPSTTMIGLEDVQISCDSLFNRKNLDPAISDCGGQTNQWKKECVWSFKLPPCSQDGSGTGNGGSGSSSTGGGSSSTDGSGTGNDGSGSSSTGGGSSSTGGGSSSTDGSGTGNDGSGSSSTGGGSSSTDGSGTGNDGSGSSSTGGGSSSTGGGSSSTADCVWGEWSDWGECQMPESQTCGTGTRQQSQAGITANGESCPGSPRTLTESCNIACPLPNDCPEPDRREFPILIAGKGIVCNFHDVLKILENHDCRRPNDMCTDIICETPLPEEKIEELTKCAAEEAQKRI